MLPFAATGMHLEGIVLSEVSQIEKDKDCKMTSYNKWKSLSHSQLFVTSWTIESMEFSRPEYWSG